MYGWMGTILRVDLSSGRIEKEPLREYLRLNYLGGRGVNSRILYDSVGPATEPLSADNIVIFGTGTVVGTAAPSAGRITVTAKSPLTGILGDANAGGHFSAEMKRAGYDHIVFTGKSAQPVYLWIHNDHVELRPAGHLWGKTTAETDDLIHEELGEPLLKVAAIGHGGENLARCACVIFEKNHAAGRTGMGAVMGSKNLKAVAVRGTKGVKVARPEAFMKLVKSLQQRIIANPVYRGLAYYGTPYFCMGQHKMGWLTMKNGLTNEWADVAKVAHRRLKKDYFIRELACSACPRHCNQAWTVTEGPYAGARGSKIEYGCIAGLGLGSYIADFPAIAYMNSLCDEYGLDVIELGMTVNAAMEWYEKGLITRKDTGGLDLTWGNAEAVITLIHQTARREGFGNLLAEGALRAAKAVGQGAEKYIVLHSKGLTYGEDDIRAIKGYALSVATSTRGADHLRGMPGFEMIPSVTTPEMLEKRFGSAEAGVYNSYKKAPLVVYVQDLATVTDCLQMCKYNTEFQGEALNMADLAQIFSLATGINMDEKAITTAAQRIYNVERAFLVREGMSRKDDVIDGKFGREPIVGGPSAGERIDPEKFSKLLDEYYELRGWDADGIPTGDTLVALGLTDIARDIRPSVSTGGGT